jgi:hypothetical protein
MSKLRIFIYTVLRSLAALRKSQSNYGATLNLPITTITQICSNRHQIDPL